MDEFPLEIAIDFIAQTANEDIHYVREMLI
jgi:hypothetical protein